MKDWRSVALIALVALVLGWEAGYTQPPTTLIDPRNPITVRIAGTVPIIIATPVNPGSNAPDTPLAKTARQYMRAVPTGLPLVWNSLADRIERGEITDKTGAIHAHNQLSAALNAQLDQVFSVGVDVNGKIMNKGVIVDSLRQGAAALGRSD